MDTTDCEFSYDHYRRFLAEAKESFEFSSLLTEPDDTRRIYLRHDLDISPANALEFGEIEADLGIRATYCLPLETSYFNTMADTQIERFLKLDSMGHDLGLHIDERAKFMERFDDLETGINYVYDMLSEVLPVKPVVSFHMPSLYDFNRDSHIGDFVNAYSTELNNEDVKYLSDSGRRWREGCLCNWVDNEEFHSFQLLIHPVWWHEDHLSLGELYEFIHRRHKNKLASDLKNDIKRFREEISS